MKIIVANADDTDDGRASALAQMHGHVALHACGRAEWATLIDAVKAGAFASGANVRVDWADADTFDTVLILEPRKQ